MKIGKFKVRLIKAALNVIDLFLISKINDEQVQGEMRTLISPISSTVGALSDTDPNDIEQVRGIWKQYVHSDLTAIADVRIKQSLALLAESKPELAGIVSALTFPTIESVRVLTDNNPENMEQLATLWGGWLTNEETATLFFDVILPFVMENVTKK